MTLLLTHPWTMEEIRKFLTSLGYPGGDMYELPSSSIRFPDGAQYRVELPSVEGPAALTYIKFGLRNHPDVYPSGKQWEAANVLLYQERVHRTALGMQMVKRYCLDAVTLARGAADFGIPVVKD